MMATKQSWKRFRPVSAALTVLSCALAGASCAPPMQDDFRSEGGPTPDATGVLEGSILYVGPRPSCEYTGTRATRVEGRVVLTLFEYDNPPPPAGSATTAINLFILSGHKLFSLTDCRPRGEEADPSETITRTVPFLWPQIELQPTEAVTYQIRGFYDADEDMNPFFSVKNLPTAGDVAGAAVVDPLAPDKGLKRLDMPAMNDARDGYILKGVVVALANHVWTERPAFSIPAEHRTLDSSARLFVGFDPPDDFSVCRVDPLLCISAGRTLELLHCGSEDPDACDGRSLSLLREQEVGERLSALDVQLDFDPAKYAFVSKPVDVLTVRQGAPDLPQADGRPDPHPVLGASAGVPWYTPAIIMRRRAPTLAQAEIEAQAGIPGVLMLGSVLLNEEGTGALKETFTDQLPIAVPPAAVVQLDPTRDECRLPYVPPGNYNSAYEARLTYCAELPTGLFSMNLLQGTAGGVPVPEPDDDISENGLVYQGSILSGQAWSIPNELGDPDEAEDNLIASQGVGGMFIVHDSEPEETGDCSVALDPRPIISGGSTEPNLDTDVAYHGLCEEGQELLIETVEGVDGQDCLPPSCCQAIAHLCGVELCPLCTEESCPGVDLSGLNVRSGPTEIVRTDGEGRAIPDCVPFALPSLCCDR